ncbi:sensor histidine kinase [Hymenobacter weizhouensis]|uniref:sensor histidine kinase n=1 Tax=Hymenobacter sp. YIM 151500-1 TaxID=2987689 RepID=UPI002226DE2A|nr:histidine kinase [Hymenobacter sp. YIM 151500-1]UYZ64027.1 histidine kinase [Hymenobacter sp. YIM 151500-1]
MLAFIRRHRVALLHASFWGVYFSFYFYQSQQEYDWQQALRFALLPLVFNATLAYANYCYLLPRWLHQKNTGRYLLEFAAAFTLVVTLRVYAQRYFLFTDNSAQQRAYLYSPAYTLYTAVGTLFIVSFVSMLRFATDWFALEARAKAMENERLLAELKFLKAQINPHFLFNTLNNLYYLAYTQSPNTTEVITKLSQMMRYMLDDSNHRQVLLSKEIEYMQNYISLEKLRLNHPIPIDLTVEGPVEDVRIVPLIFITFLENAFKHGVSNNNPAAWVQAVIRLAGPVCVFTVENSKTPAGQTTPAAPAGLGLHNLRRRLELSYPRQHHLAIDDEPDRYRVQLTLRLS